jgi:hypothetical protein
MLQVVEGFQLLDHSAKKVFAPYNEITIIEK